MSRSSESSAVPVSALLSTWASRDWDGGLRLDELSALDRVTVRTRYSTYDIVIVSPVTADVLVRGGAFFPVFTPARLAGASLGGSFLKTRSVHVGFRLELAVDTKVVLTSPVATIAVTPAHSAARGVM